MMKTYRSKSINNVLRKRPLASAMRNESGVALIITLILLTVIAAMIPATMNISRDDFSRTSNYVDSRDLFYIAEAGLEHAKFLTIANTMNGVLEGPDGLTDPDPVHINNDDNGTFGLGTIFTAPDGKKYDQVSYNGANYYIRGYDNDDGNDNMDVDGIIFIQSVGVSADGTTTKVITAMTELYNLPPTTFPSAVSLVGPISDITSTGSGFNVEGGKSVAGSITHGYALDGSADTSCAATNGIATESAGPGTFVASLADCAPADATCIVLSGGAGNKIKGVDGGSPDIGYGQTSFTAQDAQDLHAMLTAPGIPDQTYTGPHTGVDKISGVQTWGSSTDPVTVHFDDDVEFAGDITGYGVLIVDGDLNVTGSLDWHGIILVGACILCDGSLVGTGAATVYGAMVVGNSVDAAVNFTGNATIRYSCAGIDLANGVFDFTFNTVSWNEED